MTLQLQADLELEYEGHRFRLAPSSDSGELEFVLPTLAAASAFAKFGVQWGPYLAKALEPLQTASRMLPPVRIRLGDLPLMVVTPGSAGLDLVLATLRKFVKSP